MKELRTLRSSPWLAAIGRIAERGVALGRRAAPLRGVGVVGAKPWLVGVVGAKPWLVAIGAVAGLLVAILLAGMAGLALNQRVEDVTDQALGYDLKFGDLTDDLRVAILDTRHHHRNISFGGPSRGAIANFEAAYVNLIDEIDQLERLGVPDSEAVSPQAIRGMANTYYADFRPMVDQYDVDPVGFTRASDNGLARLAALEQVAEQLDRLGEEHAAAGLQEVDRATEIARLLLLALIGALGLVGAGLAYAVLYMVGQLRRLYAQQQTTAEELAMASKAKTDFIADVSHELRTPLTVLRGNAEVGLELERQCVHASTLEEIVRESAAMARMVEDLLFLARSDSASPPIRSEVIPVALFLAELAGPAELLARQRGVPLRLALKGDGELRGDPTRIEQAVMILIDNATKYSAPGKPVILKCSTDEHELRIEVDDRGPGIPEADLPRIFERFYRVDKVRGQKQGGAGLGLAIAKTIVEAHGGRIEAASRVGKGTRMTIRLPLNTGSPSTVWELAAGAPVRAR